MTPHKHAEVIKAWADGRDVEIRTGPQYPWRVAYHPTWNPEYEYRVAAAWYEEIPEQGVLCKVWDGSSIKPSIARIIDYDGARNFPFRQSPSLAWEFAEPITDEEIKQFLRG